MPKRRRGVSQGTQARGKRGRSAKPYMRFKCGRTCKKKGVRNVVHSMKKSNQLKVIDIDKQSTSLGNKFQPNVLLTEDLTYGIVHESFEKEVNTNGTIITEPADMAKTCSRRSGNEIYLTLLRFKYKLELNNDVSLNQYGEGLKMKMILVIDKYEQSIPIRKDMFVFSNAYQKHVSVLGNELDHEAMFQQGITPQNIHKGRDFIEEPYFFDKFKKINAGLNK